MSIIADVLKRFLGEPSEHNEDTGQMSFNCPACADDKGLDHGKGDGKFKLAVNYKRNIFRCWVCGFENNMRGKVPKLIKRYGNKTILRDYRLVRPDDVMESEYRTEAPEVHVSLPQGFIPLAKANDNYYKYTKVMKYLKDRGITDEIIEKYNIGYCLKGRFHDRIIIPSHDEYGDVNYFVARAWDKWVKPKYFNPEANKSELIFNEHFVNWDATIYLVEGATDHIVVPNSVPLLGKILHDRLRRILLSNARADIVILLDEDAYDEALNIYRELNVGNMYNRIKICLPPDGEDPSSVFEREGPKGVCNLLKTSYRIPESRLY